jgi:2-C-methyl-D-erythritol 4-phosphate cytidylyltransferase
MIHRNLLEPDSVLSPIHLPRASVIIPAAGTGKRFGASLPKQFLDLAGAPILVHTLKVFQETPCVESITLAASLDFHAHIYELCTAHSITKLAVVVEGGAERQDSIFNALQVPPVQTSDVVLVHDAVRPFITPEFIRNIVEAAYRLGSAVPGLVPKDTIKEVNDDGSVRATHERSRLRAIQTPQGFRREVLSEAYHKAREQDFLGTDDASVVEFAGGTVHIVPGLEENIKITTPLDFAFAELLIKAKG